MVQPSGAAAGSGSSDNRPTGISVAAATPRSASRPASGSSSSRKQITFDYLCDIMPLAASEQVRAVQRC